jgi:hypothetical protein
MARTPRDRTERRIRERAARRLVRDRERLAALLPGASAERPIDVDSAAVIDGRALAGRCPLCDGGFTLDDHQSAAPGMRRVRVTCRRCHVARDLWFRLGSSAPS